MTNKASTKPVAAKARAKKAGHGQGAVAKEVSKLLLGKSQLSYADIAERVRNRIDGAQTSTRSVASMASALRAAGHSVADRRAKA